MAAPFLMARLTVFAAFFRDGVIPDETDLIEGDNERILEEERDRREFWRLIVNGD